MRDYAKFRLRLQRMTRGSDLNMHDTKDITMNSWLSAEVKVGQEGKRAHRSWMYRDSLNEIAITTAQYKRLFWECGYTNGHCRYGVKTVLWGLGALRRIWVAYDRLALVCTEVQKLYRRGVMQVTVSYDRRRGHLKLLSGQQKEKNRNRKLHSPRDKVLMIIMYQQREGIQQIWPKRCYVKLRPAMQFQRNYISKLRGR